jgi:Protein of unknown function (DUF3082)
MDWRMSGLSVVKLLVLSNLDDRPMSDLSPKPSSDANSLNPPPTPLRCLLGSIVSGGIAFMIWQLTQSIAISFATTPIVSDNRIVVRISTAVRTLVVGMSAMGTGIFALACVGLFALGIQILFTKKTEEEVKE